MSDLDRNTIEAIIKLCRINCSEEEILKLLQDLKKILNYSDQLQELNTEGVPPCNHVLEEMVNVEREDEVITERLLTREKFLSNAPSHFGGMIKVPTVIKQKS